MYRFMSYEEIINIVNNPTHYTRYEIRCAKFHLINHIWNYKHHIKEYSEYVKKLDEALK